MPRTYESVGTFTGTGSSGTTTFTIPSGYTDLIFSGRVQSSAASTNCNMQVNNDTGTNYARVFLYGGLISPAASATINASNFGLFTANSTDFMPIFGQINNYSNTTTNKQILFQSNYDYPQINSGLWRSTAAITSITLYLESGNFTTGTIISIYGIRAV